MISGNHTGINITFAPASRGLLETTTALFAFYIMITKSLFQCASLLGLASSSILPARALPPKVTIKNGTIEGVHKSNYKQDYFLGIPFAQPPVDNLRFRNPQSIESTFNGTLQTTDYAPECFGYGVS